MSLKKYRSKRNFNKTKEPDATDAKQKKNNSKPKNLIYVIQKHAARHLHYDLRLEMKGTLKSWAIPKGPHLNPNIKRLAVEVEDHPIEYASFEGVIPKGEYGAGAVMVWDKGHWIPFGNPIQAYRKGDLSFQIKGKKLKGDWKLIRTQFNGGSDKKHWLFFKVKDPKAKEDYDILEDKPRSILSNRNIEEISKKETLSKTSSGPKSKENKLKKKIRKT